MAKGRPQPRHKSPHSLLAKRAIPKLRAFAQPGQRKAASQIILSNKEKAAQSRAARKKASEDMVNQELRFKNQMD